LTPCTYISLRETLFDSSCLLPTATVTPSDSNYVNRSASLERFSQNCEGTLAEKVPYPMGTIWSKIPYDKVARWDSYGTIMDLVCYAATQLATQLRQRCIQVVCSNKEARKRLTESNGTPAIDF